MSTAAVTVCIPSIPPRAHLLRRAVQSVTQQTLMPAMLNVAVDENGDGASITRNRAAADAETEWVAFLDDDDEFMPHHIEYLLRFADETGADYVFGDFIVPQAPMFRLDSFCYGVFDPENPLQTTITTIVRRSVFMDLGGFADPKTMTRIHGDTVGEDYDFTKRCVAAGVDIQHLQEVTWYWHHHGNNTSGRKWNR